MAPSQASDTRQDQGRLTDTNAIAHLSEVAVDAPHTSNRVKEVMGTSRAEDEVAGMFCSDCEEKDQYFEPNERPTTTIDKKQAERKLRKKSALEKRPRKLEWRRARAVRATGDFVPGTDIPVPHPSWNKNDAKYTGASVQTLRKIAADRDLDLMMRHQEVFRIAGSLAYEIKDEYAWILLLRKDNGELYLTEQQLTQVFPEWRMVLALKDTGEEPGTKACTKQGDKPAKGHENLSRPDPPRETKLPNPPRDTLANDHDGRSTDNFTRMMAEFQGTILDSFKKHDIETMDILDSIHSSIRSLLEEHTESIRRSLIAENSLTRSLIEAHKAETFEAINSVVQRQMTFERKFDISEKSVIASGPEQIVASSPSTGSTSSKRTLETSHRRSVDLAQDHRRAWKKARQEGSLKSTSFQTSNSGDA